MGTNQDSSQNTSKHYETEGCVIVLIVFTILAGVVASTSYTTQYYPLVFALGFAAIAAAILQLTKFLQDIKA